MSEEQKDLASVQEESTIDNPFQKPAEAKPLHEESKAKSTEMVEQVMDIGIKTIIKDDQKVQKSILDSAKNIIVNEVDSIAGKSQKRAQDIHYDVNKEACKNYGVDESVPVWQQKMMRFGSAMWFVVYWLFATFTIAPISVFFRGFKTFLKVNWIVIVVAILAYALIIITPILLIYLNQGGPS